MVEAFPTPSSGILWARVHCPDQPAMCDQLGVLGTPTIFYGSPAAYEAALMGGPPLPQWSEVRGMTAAEAVAATAEKFDVTPQEDPTQGPPAPPKLSSGPPIPVYTINTPAYLSDLEKATAESLQLSLLSAATLAQPGARESFRNWEKWIAAAHPSSDCREGALTILASLDKAWPDFESHRFVLNGIGPAGPTSYEEVWRALQAMNQCGNATDFDALEYVGCEVYTCGLWQSFHAMSVSNRTMAGRMTGAAMFQALHGFINNFFSCAVCRDHFLEIMDEARAPDYSTQASFALWMWRSHDRVNLRLRQEEKALNASNPERPKGFFPSPELCDACVGLNGRRVERGKVLRFLDTFYRADLVT